METEKDLELSRSNFARQMDVLGYHADGSPRDKVEVIRCKNCSNWNEWDSQGSERYGNLVCSCAQWCHEDTLTVYTRPTDFCSYAIPKEEN